MERIVVKITTGVYWGVLRERLLRRAFLSSKAEESAPESFFERLRPYLEGRGDPLFSLRDLDLEGYSPRIIRVFETLRRTAPFGRTVSYGELARIAGEHPRFVGYCMRINRFPLVIPCHRVVSSRGVGGFSYGIDLKRRLLSFEGSELPAEVPEGSAEG
ncbi:MAG TPA: methylated-DNA--[protein]-cysteine S-methyltransferase [Aquifex aeolicus]|uniref:Methylated-DNA--protein-cysteine methyltransferase n=1 Tax=Aquifex aeolicus TaxID=63363 RepID=A0A7C5L2C3_AQUAO|nr:methylated-DNA--[protein]-cysteine S-methyltransferase [Aquifex aeolicus]